MNSAFHSLIARALDTKLIKREDVVWAENLILARLGLDSPPEKKDTSLTFTDSLRALSLYAAEHGIIENTLGERDLFETELAGALMPRPSEIVSEFYALHADSPVSATDAFYYRCCAANYVRCEDIAKNLEWTTDTEFGALEITVNLSKPEKDPRDIERAAKMKSAGYPTCALCPENEGYRGRADHPARANLRIIPITLGGEEWGFQYSPYAYFNEHSIALSKKHSPMKVDHSTFERLFDFLDLFPHYFIGSNADLPIVGGSILSHEHYQCGRHLFPMMRAGLEFPITFKGFEELSCGKVAWPMPAVRISGRDRDSIAELSERILNAWRAWSDPDAFVFAETNGTPHNTVTPIARCVGNNYVIDLVLRNNITTSEHPLGVYHPHANKHNIKKENIGLIEVMGMAILPARLKRECALLEDLLTEKASVAAHPEVAHHAEWVKEYRLDTLPAEQLFEAIKDAVGRTFLHVLEDAAVYKPTSDGRAAFKRFIESINS